MSGDQFSCSSCELLFVVVWLPRVVVGTGGDKFGGRLLTKTGSVRLWRRKV